MFEGQRLSEERGSPTNKRATLPRSFRADQQPFHAKHRLLRGPVPSAFEAFYRAHLRFLPGGRLRSSDLSRFYGAWAAAAGAPSLSSREIKKAMRNIGHRAKNSNGVQYCDVGVAADCADLADNFPSLPLPAEAHATAIADRLDAMITELSSIRADVLGTSPSH
jgi:hypothetical protein